ncbi:FMN-binding protein [Candidatus Saccharibacteria bacterium]|nr:FMN-binding protein [Candidatus Saccharibacteria bacterium]
MKKSVVVILAVAIIGALGVYLKSHDSTAQSGTEATSTATSADTASNTNPVSTTPTSSSSDNSATTYKDGTYTGNTVSTIYGDVQVAAVISGGKIVDVKFLKMPDDEGHTREVTAFSEPPLKQSTLAKQSAHIDFVSGATQTSEGYEQSLQAALDQAV